MGVSGKQGWSLSQETCPMEHNTMAPGRSKGATTCANLDFDPILQYCRILDDYMRYIFTDRP